MKRFIFKTLFFTFPFSILYFITLIFYSETESPDLLRLGYIPNIYKDYRKGFNPPAIEKFDKLSKAKKRKYKILTIGDSFSEQGEIGYQNLLANDFDLLHVDRFISLNPIQTLSNMCNGDFFENYNIEYVILQSVERHFTENVDTVHLDSKMTTIELDSLIAHSNIEKLNFNYQFFSRSTIEFPFYYFPKYLLDNNYQSNNFVYNVDLQSNSLFSTNSNKLLFYHLDLENTLKNNEISNTNKLNNTLNEISKKLMAKQIKLIVLPSPDKYSLYYDRIINKQNFPKPVFFDNMRQLRKDYIYIDSKKILMENLDSLKDIYFYDDTHWSPVASKIVAMEIKNTISSMSKSTDGQAQ